MDAISALVKAPEASCLLHDVRTHQKDSHLGLERRLSSKEQYLLLQRILVQFHHPTWWLSATKDVNPVPEDMTPSSDLQEHHI